jgi:acyl-coenzyme A thioesterase PaaI-like protein
MTGEEIMRQFLPSSPFPGHLGIRLVDMGPGSATLGLTVSYLAPADGEDLQASATVLRRGRSIVHVDVDVRTASGTAVAKGLVTYKLG